MLIDSTGLKVFGAGEWLAEKHGRRSRRTWRKLHLAVNARSGQIVAAMGASANRTSSTCWRRTNTVVLRAKA